MIKAGERYKALGLHQSIGRHTTHFIYPLPLPFRLETVLSIFDLSLLSNVHIPSHPDFNLHVAYPTSQDLTG